MAPLFVQSYMTSRNLIVINVFFLSRVSLSQLCVLLHFGQQTQFRENGRDVAVLIRLSSERRISSVSGENWVHVSTFQAERFQNYLDVIDTVITLIIQYLGREVKSLRRFRRIEVRFLYLLYLCLLFHTKYCNCVTSERFFYECFLLLYLAEIYRNTGLFEMIAGVLTTCHTQYT